MNSYQLDTNAILRFLTQDRPKEAKEVELLFKRAQKNQITIEISEPVFIETAVMLRNYFKFPKEKVVIMLETILSLEWIKIENLQFVSQAISLYSITSLDLIDCLVLARARSKNQSIFTFDQTLSSLASENN